MEAAHQPNYHFNLMKNQIREYMGASLGFHLRLRLSALLLPTSVKRLGFINISHTMQVIASVFGCYFYLTVYLL